ncbi:M48 family metalloprotease [Waterburya agarophytonicola K14]|uniref:M48 family metalloprotease n=1 Tax=Waterburya agarophytonicola KI4 TaxID=2874699 RepID=A0A964BQ83_9CYAN|nr:M48 family metallopeptidase [Waterburya agarophytonicola]MCC0177390.1 M48 family metalloprotease [Waterburya agarophytonicola KI4]
MKLISLLLVGLNALMFPAIALAEFDRLENISPSSIAQLEAEEDEEDKSKSKEEEEDEESEKANEPTPEEIARLKKLATADSLYLSGYKTDAVKLYRQAKDIWEIEQPGTKGDKEPVEIFDDPEQLSPAGKVFWRNYQKGKEQELESKIFSALKLLTTREPEFISGHLHYAEMLQKYERETESRQALDRAVSRYPNEPKLVKARIEAHTAAEEWLEASILARQFSLFNPDLPEAKELEVLTEEYLAEYQSDLRSKIALSAIGNAIAGTVGFALTGSLFGPLSALETTSMLLRGESAMGEVSVKQAKKQLPLIEDPKITEYVNEIGQKVAAQSGRDDLKYEFLVIMDDSLNAFALPGGKIFVNAGAIMKTDSEAELAGLLAHEVSHAALSHGFQLVTQENLTANIVSYIPYVGNAATSLIVMNYSRGMEKQADIYGTRILVNSGYAADGVRNLMLKLHESHQEDEDNSEPPEWLSSHPNSKERVRYMEELIVDRNLNRFAYEGIARHQEAKYLVTEQWKKYDKCIEDGKIVTVEDARKCIPNRNKPEETEEEPDLNHEDN